MNVRARINQVIKDKGLSPRAVSLAAGLSDSMLHKFLTEQTRSITVDNLEKIAKALGVSLRFIMFGDEEHENVHYIWDRISEKRKAQALKVLETFADESDDSIRA